MKTRLMFVTLVAAMKRIAFAALLSVTLLYAALPASAQDRSAICGDGNSGDPLALPLACMSQPAPVARAVSKAAGSADSDQAIASAQDRAGCPPGYAFYFDGDGRPGGCAPRRATNAASKPAGLAMPMPAAKAYQNWQDCPWGYPEYDSTIHAFVSQCSR